MYNRQPVHFEAPSGSIQEIRRALKHMLPREAFRARPITLLYPLAHASIIVLAALAIGRVNHLAARIALGVIMGHSSACMGFIGHHASHGSFVRHKLIRPIIESLIWAFAVGSASSWRVYHNGLHHRREGTLDDSNRYFSTQEVTPLRRAFSLLVMPNKHLPWNPLVLLLALATTRGHALGGLLSPHKRQPGIVTNLGSYSTRARIGVAIDLSLGILIQVSLWRLSGLDLLAYAPAFVATVLVGSAVGSFYLQTQHALFPIAAAASPLNCTSLRMPRWVDWLHANVSHHTAHHVFEAVPPSYLPEVTRLMEVHFPAAIQRLRPMECWRAMFRNPVFKAHPVAPDAGLPATAVLRHDYGVQPAE